MLNRQSTDPKTRFYKFVDFNGPEHPELSKCWTWTGTKDKDGYGIIKDYRSGKCKRPKAHRVSYELHNDIDIPSGLLILHKCNRAYCVNPDHLYAGTSYDNMKDRAKACNTPGQKLTKYHVEIIRKLLKWKVLSVSYIAFLFGVSTNTVYAIKLNQTHRYVL